MQQLECAACPVLVGFGSFDVRIPCLPLYPSFGRCRVAATEKQCLHEEHKRCCRKRKTKRRKISPPVATGHGKADKQAMAGKAQRWQEPLARYSRPPILHAFLPVLSLRTCYPIPCQHAVWFLFIRLQRSGYHGRWFVPRGSFYTWHTFLIAMQVTGSSAASIVCNVSMHLAPGKLPTTYKKVTHSAAADTRFQLCYWHDHIYPRKH